MASQENSQVQGFQIAISQLIKVPLIVSGDSGILTRVLAIILKEFATFWCTLKAKFVPF